MTDQIAKDHPLSPDAREQLRIVAGIMIPASEEFGVPGADDEHIFGDMLRTLVPIAAMVSAALAAIGPLEPLDQAARCAACERFQASAPTMAAVLVALVAQCYYRDARVMRALGMEPRPPFPKGFEVEQGDWSLLDRVRARPKLYRDAP